MDHSHLNRVMILPPLRLKTLRHGHNIADCPAFGSRHHYATAVNSVVSPKHHLLAYALLAVWAHNPKKYSSVEHQFLWQKHHTASSLMWGFTGLWWFQSHPSRLQNNGDATIGNWTWTNRIQTKWSVGVKSKLKGRSVSQSVFGVFWNYISRFPLSAKPTQLSAAHQPEAERDHFHEQLRNIHPCIFYARSSCSGLQG